MNQVIVRLIGGLGNQLFQYSTARAVAYRNDVELLLDIREIMDSGGSWRYTLKHFDISARIAKHTELPPPRSTKSRYLLWRYFGSNPKFIRERGLGLNSKLMAIGPGCYLHGYFQSETYFSNISDLLRSELKIITPPNQSNANILNQIVDNNAVSLHIRRGDYLSTAGKCTFASCGLNYYANAITHIAEHAGELVIYVFSDEPEWARDNLNFNFPIIISDQNADCLDFEDIRLMSACKHNIIANSSFSWWGAWLNPNPNKIVVAPQSWFASEHPDNPDIIPPHWLRIAN